MNKNYDIFIIGATVFGLGVIEKNKDKCKIAVAERGNVSGYEFSSAYKTDGKTFGYKCVSEYAVNLRNDFIKREAMSADGEYLPAIAPVISDYYYKSGADCFFMSNVADVKKCGDKYAVTLTSFGGLFTIHAKTVIDTTSEFVSAKFFGLKADVPVSKSLNVYTTDGIYKHYTDSNDYSAIRVDIYNKFITDERKIILYASEFDYTNTCGSGIWYPSTSYGNFLESFDMGCRFDLSFVKQLETVETDIIDDGEFDIIVVGLGTAGAISAIASAERGLKVLGIENLTCMGGQATAGGVMGYYYGEKGGLYRTIDNKAVKIGESGAFVKQGYLGAVIKTVALDEWILSDKYDINIAYKYHAMSINVIKSGDKKVTGIKYVDDNGLHIAKAKFVIDCTAEATVCINAGCEMLGGRKSDGRFQPYSNVYFNYNKDNGNLGYSYIDNGAVNHYDPYEYGDAVLKSSSSYIHVRDSYADGKYLGIVPLTGLREGQHILGEQTVKFEEYITGNFPDNIIYYSLTNLDNHGKDSALEDRDYQDWITVCNLWGYCVGFPIPMGALIPKGFDGILAAGRLVSLDHTVSTGIRMKDDVQKSGEAAAVIANYAIKNNCLAKDADYDKIKVELEATECIKPSDEFKIYMQQSELLKRSKDEIWKDSFEDIAAGLDSDMPGYYIWCAKMKGDEIKPLLIDLINSDKEKGRKNAALALGLLDSCECEPVILEMIDDKSGYIPFSGRKYNTLQSISAISVAGRLGLRSVADKLIAIIEDENYTADIPLTPYDFIIDDADLRFQYVSNAIISLLQIADKHSDLRDSIIAKIRINIKELQVSMMSTNIIKYDAKPSITKLLS